MRAHPYTKILLFLKREEIGLFYLVTKTDQMGCLLLGLAANIFVSKIKDMVWIFVAFCFSCQHDQDDGNQRLYQKYLKETCLEKKEPFHSQVLILLVLLAGKSKSFPPVCLNVDWKWAQFTLSHKVLSRDSAIIFTLFIMVSVLSLVILTSVWLCICIYFLKLFVFFTNVRTEDLISSIKRSTFWAMIVHQEFCSHLGFRGLAHMLRFCCDP